jgi:hypothetical protein
MARPRVFSDAKMIDALEAKRGLVYLAAKKLGCRPATIYERAKVSEAVAGCIADQRGEVIDTAEEKLFQAVLKGQPWAIGLVLKTLGRARGYVEQQQHRHGGDAEAPPVKVELETRTFDILKLLDDETQSKLLEAMEKVGAQAVDFEELTSAAATGNKRPCGETPANGTAASARASWK